MSMNHLERNEWVRHAARLVEAKNRASDSGGETTDLASLIAATRRR